MKYLVRWQLNGDILLDADRRGDSIEEQILEAIHRGDHDGVTVLDKQMVDWGNK